MAQAAEAVAQAAGSSAESASVPGHEHITGSQRRAAERAEAAKFSVAQDDPQLVKIIEASCKKESKNARRFRQLLIQKKKEREDAARRGDA